MLGLLLGPTSTKQRIKCLAQRPYTVPPLRFEPKIPGSQVKYSTIEPRDCPTFLEWGPRPVEFGKILFEPSKLGNFMQSKITGLPF